MVSAKVEYNPSDGILNEINHREHRESIKQERTITPGPLGVWLERAILAAMVLFVVAAPNSIAATQTAWMLGLLFWLLRFLVWPRPKLYRTPIDYPMFAFGPMKMSMAQYYSNIGAGYLLYPVFLSGCVWVRREA